MSLLVLFSIRHLRIRPEKLSSSVKVFTIEDKLEGATPHTHAFRPIQIFSRGISFFLMQARENTTTFGHDRDHCRRPGGRHRAAGR